MLTQPNTAHFLAADWFIVVLSVTSPDTVLSTCEESQTPAYLSHFPIDPIAPAYRFPQRSSPTGFSVSVFTCSFITATPTWRYNLFNAAWEKTRVMQSLSEYETTAQHIQTDTDRNWLNPPTQNKNRGMNWTMDLKNNYILDTGEEPSQGFVCSVSQHLSNLQFSFSDWNKQTCSPRKPFMVSSQMRSIWKSQTMLFLKCLWLLELFLIVITNRKVIVQKLFRKYADQLSGWGSLW